MWPDPRSVYSWRTRKRTASCTTPLSYGQIQECISFTQLSLEAYEATKDEQLGTGLIELFCEFDTGHDNSRRLAGLPKGCVDRYGKKRKFLSILISNLFQEHLLDQDMADSIYERHMKNPREFWTPYPFPSMAISDPASVQDLEGNSWYSSSMLFFISSVRRLGLLEENL